MIITVSNYYITVYVVNGTCACECMHRRFCMYIFERWTGHVTIPSLAITCSRCSTFFINYIYLGSIIPYDARKTVPYTHTINIVNAVCTCDTYACTYLTYRYPVDTLCNKCNYIQAVILTTKHSRVGDLEVILCPYAV